MDSPHLSDREKAAVLWAEHVTKNTARDRRDIYDIVAKQFKSDEIVELTFICGMFNMFNRFMDSLKIPLEIQGEVDKIQRSLHLDPDKVKTYLEGVLDTWPSDFPDVNPDE